MRTLIHEIQLVPIEKELGIYPVGDLTEILKLTAKKNPGSNETGVQTTMVARGRNRRYSQFSEGWIMPP